MTAAELARQVLALLARSTREDVRARVEIGALLAGRGPELHAIGQAVGIGPRALRHAIEVRERFADDELGAYLSLMPPPSWSALVTVSSLAKARRAKLLRAWLAMPGASIKDLAREARS